MKGVIGHLGIIRSHRHGKKVGPVFCRGRDGPRHRIHSHLPGHYILQHSAGENVGENFRHLRRCLGADILASRSSYRHSGRSHILRSIGIAGPEIREPRPCQDQRQDQQPEFFQSIQKVAGKTYDINLFRFFNSFFFCGFHSITHINPSASWYNCRICRIFHICRTCRSHICPEKYCCRRSLRR